MVSCYFVLHLILLEMQLCFLVCCLANSITFPVVLNSFLI